MSLDLRTQLGPHVFVSNLEALELDVDDLHHLAKALRLRDGDPLTASDGRGAWRTAAFGDALTPTGPVHQVEPPTHELGIGVALTKAAKPEFAVQKATELGMDTIVLFGATHSVAQWDAAKQAKNQTRLERVAREAAMQSRRVSIPQIKIVDSLAMLMQTADVESHHIARADFGGVAPRADHRWLLIGPEGGWSEAERELVPQAVDLGPTVLRAETAAVVAAACLSQGRVPRPT